MLMRKRFKLGLTILILCSMLSMDLSLYVSSVEANSQQPTMVATEPIQHHIDKWAVVPNWSEAPVIDGLLDEAMWSTAAELGGFTTAYYHHSLPDVEYKLAYDHEYLYVGGTIDLVEAGSLARIEIVIQPEATHDTHYVATIEVDPTDTSVGTTFWNGDLVENFVNGDRVNVTNIEQHMYHDAHQLTVEAAIPLSSIMTTAVQPGDEWLLNILHAHQVHEGPLASWVPVRNSDHSNRGTGSIQYRASVVDHGRMGSLFFTQFPTELLPDQAVLGEGWGPQDLELRYEGFTQKGLSVVIPEALGSEHELRLLWKAPNEGWQQLIPDQVSWANGELTLSVQHPAVTQDGLYQLRLVVLLDGETTARVATLTMDREWIISAGLSAFPLAQEPAGPIQQVTLQGPSETVQQVMDIIPEQIGYRYVGLPEMPELYPDGLYTLSEDGHYLIASRTNTIYPNAQFAEDKELISTNARGETVRIPYYEDAEGKPYFVTAHLWYLQKNRALSETTTISKSDPLGAARLLYRFAELYEGYNPTVDQAWYYQSIDPNAGPPYSYWGGMWYRWYGSDLQYLKRLFDAYTEVKKTDAFAVLSQEVGEDVEQKIVEEMFLPSLDYVLTYPKRMGNLSYPNWIGWIAAGKALNEPDYIHRVVEHMSEFATYLFLSDGFWQEVTLSYHTELMSGMNQAINQLKGWSDPEGYISPRTGMRLDNLDMMRDFPIIGKALEMQNRLVYPDGKFYPLQDTHAYMKAPSPIIDAGSFLLPAAGIARLVGGQGGEQTQVYMHYPPRYKSHYHYDPLHLGLYAQGQELLPDLGYTFNTFYRWYALSTMSHNTVVVDSRNAKVGGDALHGGSIETFIPDNGLFQAMRASYEESYDSVSEYRREPWFIPFAGATSEEQGYVLDLFRVTGGNRHEYTLQGDANRDAYFNTEMALEEYGPYLLPPGTQVVEPVDNNDSGSAEGHYPGYIYVRDVQQAALTDDHYELTLVTEESGQEQAKMKVTGLLEAGTNELYLGRSPSLRAARLEGRSKDNNDEAVKYSLPKLVHRRDGTDLKSTFVTVLEPFQGVSEKIEAIDRLQPDQGQEGAVAVQVKYGATTDILLSNPGYSQHAEPLIVGDVTLLGEMGMIRLEDGVVMSMSLVGGTELSKGSHVIIGTGTVSGTVDGTLRMAAGDDWDAIVTTASVGPGAIGNYVVVEHPDGSTRGFEIGDIAYQSGKTVLVLADEDPGFELQSDGTSRQVYHPAKQWTGTHTFTIMNVEQIHGVNGPADPVSKGSISGAVYDMNNEPVSGASVHVTGHPSLSAMTNGQGMFVITDVPVGRQRVTAVTSGYALAVSDPVHVTAGGTSPVTVLLSQQLPPELSGTTPLGVRTGATVQTASSADGYVYLVPHDTPANLSALEAVVVAVGDTVYGVKAEAAAGMPVMLNTAGMMEGRYTLYAVNEGEKLSSGWPIFLIDSFNQPKIIDDTMDLIEYVGNWATSTNSQNYGGSSRQSTAMNAYVEIPFYGSRAQVLGLVGTSRGIMDVYIDGEYHSSVDTYSPNVRYQHVTFDTGTLSEGVHVIRLVVTGQRGAGATGSQISFDALALIDEGPSGFHSVTEGPLAVGTPVTATSVRDGQLYLAPTNVDPTHAALELSVQVGLTRSTPSLAHTSVTMDTYGLAEDLYRLYAVDVYSNIAQHPAPIALIDPYTPKEMVDNADSIVYFSGSWALSENVRSFGGSSMQTREKDAYVDIPFYGTRAKLLSTVGTSRGLADVYIDGAYVTTIDTYSPNVRYQHEIFDTGPLAEGVHQIRLVVRDERSEAGTNSLINFDALQVMLFAPMIQGVSPGQVYDQQVTITVLGTDEYTLILNGESIQNGQSVGENGEYTLIVHDDDGNQVVLSFTIAIPDLVTQMSQTLEQYGQQGEVNATFYDQLVYRLDIILLLEEMGQFSESIAYMEDFMNYILDPSVLLQQLISEDAAHALAELAQRYISQ